VKLGNSCGIYCGNRNFVGSYCSERVIYESDNERVESMERSERAESFEKIYNMRTGLYRVNNAGIIYKTDNTVMLQRSRSGKIDFYNGNLSEDDRICQYVKYDNKYYNVKDFNIRTNNIELIDCVSWEEIEVSAEDSYDKIEFYGEKEMLHYIPENLTEVETREIVSKERLTKTLVNLTSSFVLSMVMIFASDIVKISSILIFLLIYISTRLFGVDEECYYSANLEVEKI